MTNFKMTVRVDCVISACSLPLLFIKLSPTDFHWRKSAFGQMSTFSLAASIQNKANFPIHQPSFPFLTSSSAFERQATEPLPCSNTTSVSPPQRVGSGLGVTRSKTRRKADADQGPAGTCQHPQVHLHLSVTAPNHVDLRDGYCFTSAFQKLHKVFFWPTLT